MTAPNCAPGRLASMTREEVLRLFAASPIGARIMMHGPDEDVVWLVLNAAFRLAVAIEQAGLVGRKPLTIHYITTSGDPLPDQGRWLQLARVFLDTTQQLSINIRCGQEQRLIGNADTASIFSDYVKDLTPARFRDVAWSALFDPLPPKTDLVLVQAAAPLGEDGWETAQALAPSAATFLYYPSDAVTVLAAVALERRGAEAPLIWIEAFDAAYSAHLPVHAATILLGSALIPMRSWPTKPADAQEQATIFHLLKAIVAVDDLADESETRTSWPGAYVRGDDDSRDLIFLDGINFVDPKTGEVFRTAGQRVPAPQGLLLTHPGPALTHPLRPRPEELRWAMSIAPLFAEARRAVLVAEEAFLERRDRLLQEIGVTLPAKAIRVTGGIYRFVDLDDREGLMRAVFHGADPNQRGPDRTTPLIVAVRQRSLEALDTLMSLGADPSLRDTAGWSAVEYAALSGDPVVLRSLTRADKVEFELRPDGAVTSAVVLLLLSLHAEHKLDIRGGGTSSFPKAEALVSALTSGDAAAIQSVISQFVDAEFTTDIVPAEFPKIAPGAMQSAPEANSADLGAVEAIALAPQPSLDTMVLEQKRASTLAVVSSVAGRLRPNERASTPELLIDAAKAVVLSWLREDKHVALPNQVPDEYQLDWPTGSIITDASDTIWTLRFDDLDQAVPGRIWRTEVVVARHEDHALCSVRLVRVSPAGEDRVFESVSIPRVVSRLASSLGLEDAGLQLRPNFWHCASPDSVRALAALLSDPGRAQPVVVVTTPDAAWVGEAGDARSLAGRLAGAAHLVMLDPGMTFALTRELGRELAVFGDAARIYRSGFTTEDDRSANPVVVRRADVPPRSTIARIVQLAATLSASHTSDDDVPTFALARTLIAQARRQARAVFALPAGEQPSSVAAIRELRGEADGRSGRTSRLGTAPVRVRSRFQVAHRRTRLRARGHAGRAGATATRELASAIRQRVPEAGTGRAEGPGASGRADSGIARRTRIVGRQLSWRRRDHHRQGRARCEEVRSRQSEARLRDLADASRSLRADATRPHRGERGRLPGALP